jgi:VPDSG-CTERM motif
MKKQLIMAVAALSMAAGAQANVYTFADADYFGTIHSTGGVNPPNGSPNGVTLTFGGATPSATTTFDFVSPDATPSFVIGSPYLPATVRGTYSTQLGFQVGTHSVLDGFVTLFLRDPAGGTEGIKYTSSLNSQTITHGEFTTQLVISEGITANVAGFIDSNGFISYTVAATSGSFILDAAYMEIHATPDGGSTLTLMGCAVMGLGIFRRKVKALLS